MNVFIDTLLFTTIPCNLQTVAGTHSNEFNANNNNKKRVTIAERFRERERERDNGTSHEVVNFYDVITRLVKFTQQLVSLLRKATGIGFMNMSSEHCDWNWDWDWDCDCESR